MAEPGLGRIRVKTGKLTSLRVKNLVQPGRYGDGGGLWLQVRGADQRSWLFRYMRESKARQMGLGTLDTVTLAEARVAAADCRKQLAGGIDPISARSEAVAAMRVTTKPLTFRDVANKYQAAHEGSWRHDKHKAQWRGSLTKHVLPSIGDKLVAAVSTADVMGVLEPIWVAKPETATRIRGRIEAILDYAKAREWRTGENPARWRGHVANMLPRRNKARTVQHFRALPWKQMGAFWTLLDGESCAAAAALRLTILAATRTSETIGARWSEIDLDAGVWTIPADRMKAEREHRIPLSPASLAVLRPLATLSMEPASNSFVFRGHKKGQALSNMAMTMLIRRMGPGGVTVHGFRSSFRDWAAEATDHPREVAEAALAHTLADRVEAAYRRSDLFDKRRQLMDDWAAFCAAKPVALDVR